MTKDEALDLALETLESIQAAYPCETVGKRITAIKQARALDKKAENARELGLDYEPVQEQRWAVFCSFCNKEWSVSYQHPGKSVCLDCDDAPPAQQWVGLTDEELNNFLKAVWGREVTPKHFIQAIEAKLKERNT